MTLVAIIVGFGALRTTAVLTILGHLRLRAPGGEVPNGGRDLLDEPDPRVLRHPYVTAQAKGAPAGFGRSRSRREDFLARDVDHGVAQRQATRAGAVGGLAGILDGVVAVDVAVAGVR